MTQPWPTYCAYGNGQHDAQYRVTGRYREVVTCLEHLPKAQRWAGRNTTTTPLKGHDPPPEQPALF